MSVHPARTVALAPSAERSSVSYLGAERPDVQVEAKLLEWIHAYRERFPDARNRTVRVSYRTADGVARAEFPPANQSALGSRPDGGDDSFARSPSGGHRPFNLFSFFFGNRAAQPVAPGAAGVSLRPGPTRERAAAQNGYGVVMANADATRNRPLDPRLMSQLDAMARDLGLRVEVFSGGQPGRGEGGSRTGTTRHDHGFAADVRISRDGRQLMGNDLAPVVEYWLRRELGGVGYGMAGGGLHLDVHTQRSPFWAYSSMPPAVRGVVTALLGSDVPALRYA